METNTFIIIIVVISVIFSIPITAGVLIYRHNPKMRNMLIIGSAIVEGLIITAFILYVFLVGGGLQ